MKAVVLERFGPPRQVLQLEDVPLPEPAPGQVRVRVRATAINDWDWTFARGRPMAYRPFLGWSRPRVSILGAELAGDVDALGDGTGGLALGDAVYGDVSECGFGGFAEYACVPAAALTPIPSGMSYLEAASIPHAATLAMQGLLDEGGMQAGERVLINGAGGGVGVFAIQLARDCGVAEVTGVDSRRKLGQLRELGYDHAVAYETTDFTRTGERYDLILDTKTNRPPRAYRRALTPAGRYVTVGGSTARLLQVAAAGRWLARFGRRRMSVVALRTNHELGRIDALYQRRGLTFRLDGPHALESVPERVEYFGGALHGGKVVIDVAAGAARR
ncbi:hypothetical protein ABI59_18065 [Acidobacteria bacterium Mor1]|nr:hypothetical protein ABI59_18065 [Acidobacteria bacterium Mor1]